MILTCALGLAGLIRGAGDDDVLRRQKRHNRGCARKRIAVLSVSSDSSQDPVANLRAVAPFYDINGADKSMRCSSALRGDRNAGRFSIRSPTRWLPRPAAFLTRSSTATGRIADFCLPVR